MMFRHLVGLALLASTTLGAGSALALTEVGDRIENETAAYTIDRQPQTWTGDFQPVRADSGRDSISGYCANFVQQPGVTIDARQCGAIILSVNRKFFPEVINEPSDLFLIDDPDYVYAFPVAPSVAGGGETVVAVTDAEMTDTDFAAFRESVATNDAQLAERLDGIAAELESLRGEAADASAVTERLNQFEARLDGLNVPDMGPLLAALSALQSTVDTLQERGPAAVDVSRIRAEVTAVLGELPAEVQDLRDRVNTLSGQVTAIDGRVSDVDQRVGAQGERIAAQGQQLATLDSEVDAVTATAEDALAQAGAVQQIAEDAVGTAGEALAQAGAAQAAFDDLTADDGAITLLREDVAALTADGGPLADLRGELEVLTEDGGRLAVVEGELTALNAEDGVIATLQQRLDALVVDGGVIDQAVDNAMIPYEERLTLAENPFRSALVTAIPATADWSPARQTGALVSFGASALIALLLLTAFTSRLLMRREIGPIKDRLTVVEDVQALLVTETMDGRYDCPDLTDERLNGLKDGEKVPLQVPGTGAIVEIVMYRPVGRKNPPYLELDGVDPGHYRIDCQKGSTFRVTQVLRKLRDAKAKGWLKGKTKVAQQAA